MKKAIQKYLLASTVIVASLAPALSGAQTIIYETLFNTVNQPAADDGGVLGGFYGGGDPFFQNDAAVVISTDNATEGPDGSNCMQATALGIAIGANYAFFGTFIQNGAGTLATPPANVGLDLSAATVLRFDLKLGTVGAHDNFVAKLEDVTPTGGGEFNNHTLAISPAPNATTWTSYELNIADFLSGAQVVDMTEVSQLVIEGVGAVPSSTIDFDLLVDNVQFVDTSSSVSNWALY